MASAGEYGTSVRMMISYGGAIVQADLGKAPYYAGGVHRIVKVGLSERLPDLRARFAALVSCADVFIHYALPGECLGRLRDVANDGDLWDLVSLLFCYEVSKAGRIRVFLFGVDAPLRSASLPALVEEGDATVASGGACATPVSQGIPRSASSPTLQATSSGGACEGTAVRMKVSYGGEMIQRDVSAASYYAGGVHRIVRVGLSERLADLRPRLAALAGCSDVRIRYALPGEVVGHLRDVASDGDLWTLVSLLFFHEAVTSSSEPKQGRIRVFLFGADAPATSARASPLRRSASSPSLATSSPADGMVGGKHHGASSSRALPTLVEENEDHEDDDDTAAATPRAGGGSSTSRVTLGMRRRVSSPALATSSSSSGSDAAASTSASGDSVAPASEGDTPATALAAVQLAPVVLVPMMPATVVYPVILPVYAIRVVDRNCSVLLWA